MNSRRNKSSYSIVIGIMSVLLPIGCSGSGDKHSTSVVTGSVTLDGTPLTAGRVIFHGNEKHVKAIGFIQSNGTYRALNVPQGETIKVSVEVKAYMAELQNQMRMNAQQNQMMQEEMKRDPERFKDMMAQLKQPIEAMKALSALKKHPAIKFEKAETSGLTTEVESGENTYNIELTSN